MWLTNIMLALVLVAAAFVTSLRAIERFDLLPAESLVLALVILVVTALAISGIGAHAKSQWSTQLGALLLIGAVLGALWMLIGVGTRESAPSTSDPRDLSGFEPGSFSRPLVGASEGVHAGPPLTVRWGMFRKWSDYLQQASRKEYNAALDSNLQAAANARWLHDSKSLWYIEVDEAMIFARAGFPESRCFYLGALAAEAGDLRDRAGFEHITRALITCSIASSQTKGDDLDVLSYRAIEFMGTALKQEGPIPNKHVQYLGDFISEYNRLMNPSR